MTVIDSNDLRLYFGLGSETKIDSIEVRWPNGESETFPALGVEQYMEISEAKVNPTDERPLTYPTQALTPCVR